MRIHGPQNAEAGGRHEGTGDSRGVVELDERGGIPDIGIGHDKKRRAGIQHIVDVVNGGDEVHRRIQGQHIRCLYQPLAVPVFEGAGLVQVSELVQHALGVACGARRIDQIRQIVRLHGLAPLPIVVRQYLRPVVVIDDQLAVGVVFDECDALRSVAVLTDREGCAGPPDADHCDGDLQSAGQAQQDRILPSDAVLLQIAVDTPGVIVQLTVGDAWPGGIVPQGELLPAKRKMPIQMFQ